MLKDTGVSVLLLTNDRANRERATKEGLNAVTLQAYVGSLSDAFPNLKDYVAVQGQAPITTHVFVYERNES